MAGPGKAPIRRLQVPFQEGGVILGISVGVESSRESTAFWPQQHDGSLRLELLAVRVQTPRNLVRR